MDVQSVTVPHPSGKPYSVGTNQPLLLLGGPCALESEEIARKVATTMQEICDRLDINYVFKASFDKANRTSLSSYRGPGMQEGLATLARLREELQVPVVSDIHEPYQAEAAGQVLDLLQIPAFLCRQTDLLAAAAATGKPVNVKKGQFVSPWDMQNVVGKLRGSGCKNVMLVERGASFGYNNLVVDMRSLPVMRSLGCPVIFDATHSVQLPGGAGGSSGGQREFITPLTKAAMAAGIDGLFMEIHPDPDSALCDGPNSIPLSDVEKLLTTLLRIREAAAE
ncbi:3-deoxy-8-phosphooctulonate synthase [Desulfopila sp. IMCC35008]|uniref:3-deoxy-8-phosphooctulonate synthase n=1 Tax=Desulfopila sp. IMCC35008 TaxID=2653858 RepID=UPI0013D6CDF8|nr:3-deoxy-8-phosphooctulonate synthase [Desulfopila sp. IMCC35008]